MSECERKKEGRRKGLMFGVELELMQAVDDPLEAIGALIKLLMDLHKVLDMHRVWGLRDIWMGWAYEKEEEG